MTPRNHDIEASDLIVLLGDDNNSYSDIWALFNTSRTVEYRFVMIHWEKSNPNENGWRNEMLVTFSHVDELLLWCAYKQKAEGAVFRGGTDSDYGDGPEFLDKLCGDMGWGNFKEYVAENCDFIKK